MNYVTVGYGLLCFCLQAFESELQSRSGAVGKARGDNRHLRKSDDASVDTDDNFENLISLSAFALS